MKNKTFIIAEIGTAHQGNIKKAESLINAAAESGADCAKFQVVFANEIIHPLTGTVPLPGGDIPLYDTFKKLEQDISFYKELKILTEKNNMVFMASPFGTRSAELLYDIGSELFKIASPELNYYPLLEKISSFNKKVILSTGVSTLGDIEEALKITGRKKTSILHCITAYPAPPEQYNLSLIPLFNQLFGVKTGISDHSTDPVLVPSISTALGASIIEKHFTLSNKSDGLDDPIALTPPNFKLMSRKIRDIEGMDRQEAIDRIKKEYSPLIVDQIIGTGEKKLAPAEAENYLRTNRSLHALEKLRKGTILTEKNCALLRTEKILRPGLSPLFFQKVLGKKVKAEIPDGEGIRLEDLI